ncbi:MAG: hypothetical protein ACJAR4_002468 [Psychroserpens sp.]|jgi:hypothetical protein
MTLFNRIYFFCGGVLLPILINAQCSMCRTQVVNNVSHGETALAAGLNLGIIYLFVTPYIAIGIVAFFWFKNAKVNEKKKRFIRDIRS